MKVRSRTNIGVITANMHGMHVKDVWNSMAIPQVGKRKVKVRVKHSKQIILIKSNNLQFSVNNKIDGLERTHNMLRWESAVWNVEICWTNNCFINIHLFYFISFAATICSLLPLSSIISVNIFRKSDNHKLVHIVTWIFNLGVDAFTSSPKRAITSWVF